MEFIELSGRSLLQVVTEEELTPDDLSRVGVTENTIVRVNRQGDIEVRRNDGWDVIGGLLGDFEHRIKKQTGLDWAQEAS
jgi:hypothetical protein